MSVNGGVVPSPRGQRYGQPFILSPGEIWCDRCDWECVGGTERERMDAFSQHVRRAHRDRP